MRVFPPGVIAVGREHKADVSSIIPSSEQFIHIDLMKG